MVYIDRDGRVLQQRPWNLQRILDIFIGIWFVMVQFSNRSSSDNRRGGFGAGGGGGFGGGGGGSGPRRGGGGGGGFNEGLRPNRHIGRVENTSMDCPGCGCG